MNKVDVTCKITTYPDDYKEGINSIEIKSHWSNRNKVILVIDGKQVTIIGSDLMTAITNCMNTN